MKNIKIFLAGILLLFTFSGQVFARQLCDCYGNCIFIYPREVSTEVKRMVKVRDGHKPWDHLEIDHKLPLCLGGTNDISNLQALTSSVHRKKTEHDMYLLDNIINCGMTVQEAQDEALKWNGYSKNSNVPSKK